jgi:Flp pilus assembly protein CpaB
VSRRARAVGFLALAVACAGLAAMVANGYSSRVAQSFGPLRPVVIASRDLPPGEPIGLRRLSGWLETRRVPARFVPPAALSQPRQAIGLVPAAAVPAGSYLTAPQLRSPAPDSAGGVGSLFAGGRRPVEIAISGGEALLAGGASPEGSKVDVVVVTEPRGPGPGHTFVAAEGVPLLALAQRDPAGPGPSLGWSATLALTRSQALELIEAESFARGVRLLPRPGV